MCSRSFWSLWWRCSLGLACTLLLPLCSLFPLSYFVSRSSVSVFASVVIPPSRVVCGRLLFFCLFARCPGFQPRCSVGLVCRFCLSLSFFFSSFRPRAARCLIAIGSVTNYVHTHTRAHVHILSHMRMHSFTGVHAHALAYIHTRTRTLTHTIDGIAVDIPD